MAFVPPIFIRVAWRCLQGDASVLIIDMMSSCTSRTLWLMVTIPLYVDCFFLDNNHTNNNAEGWHSKSRSLLNSTSQYSWGCHPLQSRAGSHRSKNNTFGSKRRKYRKLEKRLIIIKENHEAGDYTFAELVEAYSH